MEIIFRSALTKILENKLFALQGPVVQKTISTNPRFIF